MEMMISHLDQMGHDFIYLKANNGRDACKIAQNSQPDLIIMDWEMPKLNGIRALILLKRNELTRNIPVVITSAFSDALAVHKALKAGAMDYIRKPIEPIELIARVRSVLALNSSIKALKQKQGELEIERRKVESILQGIIPSKILNDIKETGYSKPQRYKNATVMFSDLVGFTKKTNNMSPKRLIDELNDIFSTFDKIIVRNRCTRIKTIGDAYLAVCGLPEEDPKHAERLIRAATEFRDYIKFRNETNLIKWEITIGINSGDVIGSLVGLKNYLFDVFGTNVNAAARLQSQCAPMEIAISPSTYKLAHNCFSFEEKGKVKLKGLNEITIYNVLDEVKINNLGEIIPEFQKSTPENLPKRY
jgi:class 3 adenylate cyclase/CheY-like chemotaxis protein